MRAFIWDINGGGGQRPLRGSHFYLLQISAQCKATGQSGGELAHIQGFDIIFFLGFFFYIYAQSQIQVVGGVCGCFYSPFVFSHKLYHWQAVLISFTSPLLPTSCLGPFEGRSCHNGNCIFWGRACEGLVAGVYRGMGHISHTHTPWGLRMERKHCFGLFWASVCWRSAGAGLYISFCVCLKIHISSVLLLRNGARGLCMQRYKETNLGFCRVLWK